MSDIDKANARGLERLGEWIEDNRITVAIILATLLLMTCAFV